MQQRRGVVFTSIAQLRVHIRLLVVVRLYFFRAIVGLRRLVFVFSCV